MKLLIKFPTRGRSDKFFKVLDLYYSFIRDNNFLFVVSCDVDDTTMNNPEAIAKLDSYPYLKYSFDYNKTKVEAINNNLSGVDFDVLLLASDDMIPVCAGYDKIIKEHMKECFPDTDGVLWFNDGFQQNKLNTLCILGKKYYERFNYIYHPSYSSLYCDAEFTMVSQKLKKVQYFDKPIIEHQQYSIINEQPDELYIRNDSLQNKDREIFAKRLQTNFL